MFRHVVLFRWDEDATEAQLAAVRDGLRGLATGLAHLGTIRFGDDAGLRAGNFDLALVGDFPDRDAYRAYAEDAGHQRFIAETLRPVLGERAAVQYELDDPREIRS